MKNRGIRPSPQRSLSLQQFNLFSLWHHLTASVQSSTKYFLPRTVSCHGVRGKTSQRLAHSFVFFSLCFASRPVWLMFVLNSVKQQLNHHDVYPCDSTGPVLLRGEAARVQAVQRRADVTFAAGCVYLNVHLNIIKQEITCAASPVMEIESDSRGDRGQALRNISHCGWNFASCVLAYCL